jgi:hypothetical protein
MTNEPVEPPLKYYWVTMKVEANYTLLVPAISEVEAVILADEMNVPVDTLTEFEKDVIEISPMNPL